MKHDTIRAHSRYRLCGDCTCRCLLPQPDSCRTPQGQVYPPKSNRRNRISGTNCAETVVSCLGFRGVQLKGSEPEAPTRPWSFFTPKPTTRAPKPLSQCNLYQATRMRVRPSGPDQYCSAIISSTSADHPVNGFDFNPAPVLSLYCSNK
eukprot:2974596-Rhodomonas_salina.1